MLAAVVSLLVLAPQLAERSIPAFRAYSEPDPEGISIPDSGSVPGWTNPKNHLVWFAKFRSPGIVQLGVRIHATVQTAAIFRLEARDARGRIAATKRGIPASGDQSLDFGSAQIVKPGYVKFDLSSDRPISNVAVESLTLNGAPVSDALINETRWRSSASVHLRWPTPKGAPVSWFYNEIVPRTSPLSTYYMACGWARGYFGIQVNSPTERRVIFSVWDSGSEKVSRDKVDKDLQVQLVGKGDGVFTGSFGNEGTGGHSHLVYPWKTGQTQRFLVRALPKGNKTIYSGYYYFNDTKRWGLISSWIAPQDGTYLRSLYSFIEDFWGGEGQRQRLADYGPAWVRTGSEWTQVRAGSFTHTARMANYREDYFFKVNGTRVTASAGGYTDDGPVAYGAKFEGVLASRPPGKDVMEFVSQVEAADK
ncbi:MAG: DUF3472 domain-containing protein [Fimbriimonas sp.]|nr:DUF3472 domain-containing protein [Fimbriimonas sp.]